MGSSPSATSLVTLPPPGNGGDFISGSKVDRIAPFVEVLGQEHDDVVVQLGMDVGSDELRDLMVDSGLLESNSGQASPGPARRDRDAPAERAAPSRGGAGGSGSLPPRDEGARDAAIAGALTARPGRRNGALRRPNVPITCRR